MLVESHQTLRGLEWLVDEVEINLVQAYDAFLLYLEDREDVDQLNFCLGYIHQVKGALELAGSPQGQLFVEELESLVEYLSSTNLGNLTDASETLVQSLNKVPAYLRQVVALGREVPESLLPLFNDLRALRRQPLWSETLFKPELSLLDQCTGLQATATDTGVKKLLGALRKTFQSTLLGLLKGEVEENSRALEKACSRLRELSRGTEKEYLWWAAGAFVEGLFHRRITLGPAAKKLLRDLEFEVRALHQGGLKALAAPVSRDLMGNLLYYIAFSGAHTPRIQALSQVFGLHAQLSPEWRTGNGEDERRTYESAVIRAITDGLSEQVEEIKELLEEYLAAEADHLPILAKVADIADSILSTLKVVDKIDLQKAANTLAEALRSSMQRDQTIDGKQIEKIAELIVELESALSAWRMDALRDRAEEDLPADQRLEINRAWDSIVGEIHSSVELIKGHLLDYLGSAKDSSLLSPLPGLVRQVAGAMEMIGLGAAANTLAIFGAYVKDRLLEEQRQPESQVYDALADIITAVEHYLDEIASGANEENIATLALADRAIGALGLEPLKETGPHLIGQEETPAGDHTMTVKTENDGTGKDSILEEPVATPVVGEGIDPEIREIFVDEANEVLSTLDEFFPRWQANPGDGEALTETRRAFHTLKGSGRMVGAEQIGELAWGIENMLNRAIDGRIETSSELFSCVAEVLSLAPAMVAAFERGDNDYDRREEARLLTLATQLANGESTLEEAAAERTETDPALLEIFVKEAHIHLDVVQAFVAGQNEKKPFFEAPTPTLQAALHTLKGSAHMANIQNIAQLITPLERLIKEMLNFQLKMDENTVELLADCCQYCDAEIAVLEGKERASTEALPELLARLNELRDALMGSVLGQDGEAATQVDPAFLNLLMVDGLQNVMDVEHHLQAWAENETLDVAKSAAISAELGELQSAADKAGFFAMARLSHCLGLAYERLSHFGKAPAESVVAALIVAHEALLTMIDAIAAHQEPPAALPALLDEIDALCREPSAVEERSKAVEIVEEVDSDIVELFLGEAEELLEHIEQTFDDWRQEPDGKAAVEELKRHLHTFKGGARMAGLVELGDSSHDLESQVVASEKAIAEGDNSLLEALIAQQDLLIAGVAKARAALAATVGAQDDVDEGLVEDVVPSASTEPDTSVLASEADAEVIELFLVEAEELLESLEQELHSWRDAPGSSAFAETIQRILHTFKGGARMAGLKALGDLSHALESQVDETLVAVSSGNPSAVALLLTQFDGLAAALGEAKQALSSMGRVVSLDAKGAPTPPASSPSRPEKTWTTADILPFTGEYRGLYPEKRQQAQDALKGSQELVRIQASIMDMLVNLAGETSISRAQVEQNINEFIFSLDEMEATIRRMHDQVRRLSIETDAQVMFRREQIEASDSSEGFDPLEMDRYSQLQQLSRSLLESASDLQDLRDTLVDKSREAESLLLHQSRINTDLQEGLMNTRMVPFSRVVPRLRRLVRQVSSSVDRQVNLYLGNVEGELDRTVLERIMSPLEHMIRNAIDHGIESEGERKILGKAPQGTISISFAREGGDVLIRIADDGRGLNIEAIREKAFSLGLLEDHSHYTDSDIAQFIFHPGFSTSQTLTQLSGRGVGMDVVNSEVRQLGGSVTMTTQAGAGTEFQIRLPFTVSVNRALMIELGEDSYALALNSISGVTRISTEQLMRHYKNPEKKFEYAGEFYEIRYLGSLLASDLRPTLDTALGQVPLVLIRSDDKNYAVQVDALIGSHEIVVKSLGGQFSRVPGLSGATVLGDGRVVVILDLQSLLRDQTATKVIAPLSAEEIAKEKNQEQELGDNIQTVMVVDDSVTVRKVTSRFLEREGFRVVTAKDGVDAMRTLQEITPDLMLLDIEMPRMDGFEVARLVRSTQRLKDLPIIMITSRTGEKHRERALAMGVNRYLGKPYQEEMLVREVYSLLTSAEAG